MKGVAGLLLAVMLLTGGCANYPYQSAYQRIEDGYAQMGADTRDSCITPFIEADSPLVPDGKRLMQIMIVRHGKPLLKIQDLYTWEQARNYIHAYDTVGVEQFLYNPVCMPTDLENVYCSVLERSKETAEYICGDDYVIVEDLMFREFERQILKIPVIKMPLFFWLITARIPWILGFGDIESYAGAVARSEEVSDFLAREANKHGKALLVAHGFLNRFVADALEERGWYVAKDGGHDYLSTSLFIQLEDTAATGGNDISHK